MGNPIARSVPLNRCVHDTGRDDVTLDELYVWIAHNAWLTSKRTHDHPWHASEQSGTRRPTYE